MEITTTTLHLTKLHPLTISRGTSASSTNLLVEVDFDGVTGQGEVAPYDLGSGFAQTADMAVHELACAQPALAMVAPYEMQKAETVAADCSLGPAARAALDLALYDWLGKRLGVPVYRLVGADLDRIVPTSLTIGINPPEEVRERVKELQARTGTRCLKVKLGSPEGLDHDRAILVAVLDTMQPGTVVRVDANGGWNLAQALLMLPWLAERGVEYVEQPLPLGNEKELVPLHKAACLPIYADESCRSAADIPLLAGKVDGVNLKLMKAGGIREGLRLIHTARAHGLKVMMGCMSESSLGIAGSAAISSYADELDLDSHLNLHPDPFAGLLYSEGRVLPSNHPGLGVERVADE